MLLKLVYKQRNCVLLLIRRILSPFLIYDSLFLIEICFVVFAVSSIASNRSATIENINSTANLKIQFATFPPAY